MLKQTRLHRNDTAANLSLVLGWTGNRFINMVGAYRALAIGGRQRQAVDSNRWPAESYPWFDPAAARIVAVCLSQVAPLPSYRSRHKVGWETGTSLDGHDACAIGVIADYTIETWNGFVNGSGDLNRSDYLEAGELLFDSFNLLPADRICWRKLEIIQKYRIC